METELRERIVIDGAEAAAQKLGMMSTAANRVMGAFQSMGHVVGALGGIAGLWQIVEGIHDVDRLFQSVMRVKDMTGIAADHAHAMFDMFELSGVEMAGAERIITMMTKQGQKLEDAMGGVGGQSQRTTQLMHQLGISIKDGPEERLFAMAKAAQAGKLDMAELSMAFAIPRGQASAMMSMLKQGPDKLRAIQKETLAGADVIDDKTLESYRNMLQIRRELKDAWGDLIGVFYKNLIPAITATLGTIKKLFDDIAPVAALIGKTLSEHTALAVSAAKTYLALLIASKAVNMVSGESMGIVGRGRQLFGGAASFLGRGRAAGETADYFAAKEMFPKTGMFGKAGGGLVSMLTGGKGVGGGLSAIFGSLGTAVRAVASVFLRFAPIGLVITAVLGVLFVAFEMLKKNVLGIRDLFGGSLGRILSTFKDIIGKVISILMTLWNAIKPIVMVVAGALMVAFLALTYVVEGLAAVIDAVVTLAKFSLDNSPIGMLAKWLGSDAPNPADDAKRGTGDAHNQTIHQDFRGSKFEIMNNFPPGIDGGRVAVAFGDDLAKLGERRLDAGIRPLFSFR